jgi:hypothetical protein
MKLKLYTPVVENSIRLLYKIKNTEYIHSLCTHGNTVQSDSKERYDSTESDNNEQAHLMPSHHNITNVHYMYGPSRVHVIISEHVLLVVFNTIFRLFFFSYAPKPFLKYFF